MLKKKKIRILIAVLTVTIGFVLLINVLLESILKEYIAKELDVINAQNEYVLGITDVDVNIFLGNISISDFHAKPNEQLFASFAKGETKEDALKQVFVSKASLSGLGLFNLVINRKFNLDGIEIDTLHFNFYKPYKDYQVPSGSKEEKINFSLDSIHLSGIHQIDLAEMKISDYGIYIIDASNKDTISSYQGKEFLFKGLDMNSLEESQGYFTFNFSELELELKQQEFNLEGGLYAVSFDDLHYNYGEQKIELINFELKPIASPTEFASKFNQVYDITAASIDTLLISGLDIDPLFQSGVISIQQIDFNGLKASVFKDKTKPWDTEKIKKLPQMALKNMKQPLFINTLKINNSTFIYSEKLGYTDNLVNVNINNIQAEITYITSIRDSLTTGKNLDIKLNTDILNTLPFYIHITMPYNTQDHSFYASGYTKGTSDLEKLNPTVFPAIAMKFKKGKLDGINFSLQGNSTRTKGELTMLYEDLEVELFKKNESENKTISWVANTFVKRSNPHKNGKTIVGVIDFERVKYKGIANYLWKSVESGVVNSMAPFGKHKKKEHKAQKK